MKRLLKIFNIIVSIVMILALTGCMGVEAQLTSCLEQLSQMLDNSGVAPPDDENSGKPETIELVFPEGRFSLVTDAFTYRDCYVLVNGSLADTSYDIAWRFNDEESSHTGRMYTFAPSAVAQSVSVEAVLTYTEKTDEVDENGDYIEEVTELVAKETFVYYESFSTPTATCIEEDGVKTYTITGFSNNNLIEWFVNGEKESEGAQFVFSPTIAGRYTVSATVNGVEAEVENPHTIKQGPQTVTDVIVDIDTYYPQVCISFNGDPLAKYIVRKTSGSNYKDYTADTNMLFMQYSEFFSISSYTGYSVSVKTVDDEVYIDSPFSSSTRVELVPNVTAYLNKTYGISNAYISSEEEFYEQFDHMMLSRKQPENEETSVSRDFYFGFKIDGGIDGIVNRAFDACGYTGSYRLGAKGNNPYTVTIYFKTGNIPDIPAVGNIPDESEYAVNMNGYPLSVSSKGMVNTLPIDSKTKKTATNTDQLYRFAELGYCPVPQSGSVAETVMNNARQILSVIIDEDMSDYEIALAIYDWVMYKNNYNNEVLKLTTETAVRHPAFYLEGMMYAGNYGYAVCDGISKAYSLLCNMAGVECMRVVGEAGENGNWGGHAWNKVKVDGNWYIVDATWGDLSMGITYKTGTFISKTYTDYYELGMHNYFLVTDSFVKGNHKEDSGRYPKTAPLPYNHYAKQTMTSGKTVDLYLNETGTALKNKLDVIADAIVSDVRGKNRIQTVSVGETTKQSYYFFYELGYSELAESSLETYMSATSSFAKKFKLQNYGFSLFEVDGAVGIIVSYHYGSRLPSGSLSVK